VAAPSSTPPRAGEWLAVVGSATDPNDLDGPRSEVVAALGSDDGARVIVSPGACFTGIAERYAARYVLALTERSRAFVEDLVGRTGTNAEWIGPVTSTCVD
jgi:hypothetical protein